MYELFTFRIFQKAISHFVWVVAAVMLFGTPAHGADPVSDNPLAGRYEGAEMVLGEIKSYDEVDLINGPMSLSHDLAKSTTGFKEIQRLSNVVRVEGKVSDYQYRLPDGIGLLDVQRNYERNLESKGFEVVFACKVTQTTDDGCFKLEPGSKLGNPSQKFRMMLGLTNWPAKSSHDIVKNRPTIEFFFRSTGRYLLMKRERAEGTDYVSIALSEKSSDMAYDHGKQLDESTLFMRVVESKAVESDKIVFMTVDDMKKSLNETGHVNLYGIYFDIDKDVVKPESKPTIDEIVKLMHDDKELRLRVVGHTDSTGSEPHNQDLSNRRAASVIRALTEAGVDSSRFASRGAGSSEPVESNDTVEGRAKNRRVELVRM